VQGYASGTEVHLIASKKIIDETAMKKHRGYLRTFLFGLISDRQEFHQVIAKWAD